MRASEYARRVVDGEIPAGEYLRLACTRHFADLEAGVWEFDEALAEKAVRFIEMLPHTKGRWAARAERITLEPWQCFIVASLFGWVDPGTRLRRYREAYLEIARKNGKSLLAAAIGLYMFVADGEHGAEVYSGASTEKQAWEVFRPARLMVKNTPELREAFDIEVNASNLVRLADYSKFEPLIGNPGDGASPSCAIADEYHEHKSAAQYETMQTGMGSREQPLQIAITTAGDDLAGPCYEKRIEAINVLKGVFEAERFFSVIYTLDDGDDWTDPAVWPKANPNIGISISEEYIAGQVASAMRSPAKQSSIKKKHFNLWSGARSAFVNMEQWKAAACDLKREDLKGAPFIVGLDLATRVDLAARVDLAYRQVNGVMHYYCFPHFYLPESALLNMKNSANIEGWAKQGFIELLDGDEITFSEVEQDIRELPALIDLRELAYDPWQTTQLAQNLDEEGLRVVEYRATVKNFTAAMREVEGALASGRFHHDNNPVMNWCASNVVTKTDPNDNVFPRKDVPENKIDGMVALYMAVGRAMYGEQEGTLSDFLSSAV